MSYEFKEEGGKKSKEKPQTIRFETLSKSSNPQLIMKDLRVTESKIYVNFVILLLLHL